MDTFLTIDTQSTVPEQSAPAPDRIIAGSPKFRTWNFEEVDGLYAGIWEASPGVWRIAYSEWEFCHILAGHSILTEDGASPRHLRAGDAFILRPGFNGIWEVVETTRKHYVIRL